ncbi:MAG: L-lysine 6-transaminase [Thermoplasmata archaeon M9B1D]|nr:MAG: L-lysine 6-transaminase [Thermoplasmata archaeon M9B1D]
MAISPKNVHEIISKYMLADGLDLVLDLKKSKGCQIYDSRKNRFMLDCFSFFATSPLGVNHPELLNSQFIEKIGEVAINKPTNSDIYTIEMAEFVDSFAKQAMPDFFRHLFFVSGGALAIENGLKTAFDWKIRKNVENGKNEKLGTQVIHFKEAFHGRSGYTLSLTNTFNLDKIKYFPKFNWPRIINPKITFPLNTDNLEKVQELENKALSEIDNAVLKNPDDIAALIIEPIQGEGGDNHFRNEFFIELRKLCDIHDMMFIIDEIQTGVGLTGKMWAFEHFDFKPDILAFGKKTQVCGIMVNDRVEEVKDNVFRVPSRLNSTWGGNLVDMVRFQKYLEVIKKEKLIKNSEIQGKRLLEGLLGIHEKYPDKMLNPRGRGLMCSFDLQSSEKRDEFRKKLYSNDMIILGCGARTIRFRPPLIFSSEDVDKSLDILKNSIKSF